MAMLSQHCIRMEDDLWEKLGNAAKATSPELTRSMALRELVRWWIDPTDANLRIGYPPAQEKDS
jgi:hypothetical protein